MTITLPRAALAPTSSWDVFSEVQAAPSKISVNSSRASNLRFIVTLQYLRQSIITDTPRHSNRKRFLGSRKKRLRSNLKRVKSPPACHILLSGAKGVIAGYTPLRQFRCIQPESGSMP